jgi:hypothetical protein
MSLFFRLRGVGVADWLFDLSATLVWFFGFSLASAMRLAARALPLCGVALTFFTAAKKVSKESGLTPPILVFTHGPPTSPFFSPQHASPLRCQRTNRLPHPLSASTSLPAISNIPSPCGKLCVGSRAAQDTLAS